MIRERAKYIYYVIGIGLVPPTFFRIQAMITGEHVGGSDLIMSLFFSCSVTVLICSSVYFLSGTFERKFPWETTPTRKRIFLQLLTSISTAVVIMVLYMMLFYLLVEKPMGQDCILSDEVKVNFFNNIVITIVLTAIANLIWEGGYLAEQWKKSMVETEKFKRKNIQSQFESLKNQVNPHFLFNSLNALSSLVQTDPNKAEEFISEFAKIYRYVLDMKDKFLVPLREEYQFIRSFIFLHKIRFGSNLQVNIDISEDKMDDFIPPLSLQELIENAIKHNIVSKENPLYIDIFIEKDHLVIRNNLQKRIQDIPSTGTGQKNLKERYDMLSSRIPSFQIEEPYYIAKIPLIKEED